MDLNSFKPFTKQKPTSKSTSGVNAVIYTRVSHFSQEHNTSLESQRKYCEQFAKQRGLNVIDYFGGTYESAKTDDRKEFNRMLAFVKKSRNVSYIIVYSYERFSRSGISGAQISDDLMCRFGVLTLAVTQELDPTTPSGSFQQKILFLFSQMDNEMRREKSMTGMQELLRKGYFPYAPPIGYTNLKKKSRAVDHEIVVNETGKLIRKAFLWKANEQMGNSTIARRLQLLGTKIDDRRLTNIFRNPFYCGVIVSKIIPGEMIEGKHESLISKSLFLKANEVTASRRTHPLQYHTDDPHLPLKRQMKCRTCGTPMTGYIVQKKQLYYYKCRIKGCHSNRRSEKIHEEFMQLLSDRVFNSQYVDLLLEAIQQQFTLLFKEHIDHRRNLKIRLGETKNKIATVEERFTLGKINEKLYEKYLVRFNEERTELEQELKKSPTAKHNLKGCLDFTRRMAGQFPKLWEASSIGQQGTLQRLIFPEGFYYNKLTTKLEFEEVGVLFGRVDSKDTSEDQVREALIDLGSLLIQIYLKLNPSNEQIPFQKMSMLRISSSSSLFDRD